MRILKNSLVVWQKENISWIEDFKEVHNSEFQETKWFVGGKTNITLNCIDRHLEKNGDKLFVRSGQSVSVNLIVRNRRIISLLTDAVDKAIDSLKGIKS